MAEYSKTKYKHSSLSEDKADKLTADKIYRLEDIDFVWNPKQKIWDDTFNLLKDYIAENHKPPSRYAKVGKTALGQWYAKQMKACNEGLLENTK